MTLKTKIVGILLMFTLFIAGCFSFSKQVYAFSSVLGASKIAPNAQLYIDGILAEKPEDEISAKTNKPTFFGYTLGNVKVEYIVSSNSISGQTTSDSTGYWVKQIDTSLEPGLHTISLNLTDAAGVSTGAFLAGTFRVPEVLGTSTQTNTSTNTQPNTRPPLNKINYLTITLIVIGSALALSFLYLVLRRLHRV